MGLRIPLKSSISIRFFNLSNPVSTVHLFLYNSFKSSVVNSSGVKLVASISGSSFPISTNAILISNRPIFLAFSFKFSSSKLFNLLFIILIWIISSLLFICLIWWINTFFGNRIKNFEFKSMIFVINSIDGYPRS